MSERDEIERMSPAERVTLFTDWMFFGAPVCGLIGMLVAAIAGSHVEIVYFTAFGFVGWSAFGWLGAKHILTLDKFMNRRP